MYVVTDGPFGLVLTNKTSNLKTYSNWQNEPQHDKTNKMNVRPAKPQISLGIRPVWSESLLSAWRNIGSLATHWAHSEGSVQTGQMPRLIWVFAGRTVTLLVLSCRGSNKCKHKAIISRLPGSHASQVRKIHEWIDVPKRSSISGSSCLGVCVCVYVKFMESQIRISETVCSHYFYCLFCMELNLCQKSRHVNNGQFKSKNAILKITPV